VERVVTEQEKGKVAVLDYLISIAQNTQGAEVWRSLFAELRQAVISDSRRITVKFADDAVIADYAERIAHEALKRNHAA
jgi:hypothetical protein